MEITARRFLLGLLAVTLAAGVLRFHGLGQVPVALYCDEAFSAYEAYSLLETGRDSQGRAYPLFFDIFGKGWGEPLYIYFTMVPVAAAGLTAAAARAVAALSGTLAVLFTGLMTASLVSVRDEDPQGARLSGWAAAALMAVSPWSFHLSRVAFQASLLPAVLAISFWLAASWATDERRRAGLAAAGIVAGLSLYTYTVARLATPLLMAGFAWTHRRRLARHGRGAAAAVVLFVLLALPIAGFSLTGQGQQRLSDVSILNRPGLDGPFDPATWVAVAANYVGYYSPGYLVARGDPNERHSIRDHGLMHPHGYLLLMIGVVSCLRRRAPGGRFLLWWLAAFPVAASLTVSSGHAVRAICGEPGVYALAGIGAASVWRLYRRSAPGATLWPARILLMSFLAGAAVSTGGYFMDYFHRYPVYSGPDWQYGMKQAYESAESLADSHDSIYVTRNEDFPYIHLLFHRAFPPAEFQKHRLSRTRYLFDQDVYYRGPDVPGRMNPVFILKPWEAREAGLPQRKVIHYPDGSEAFVITW